ncbi:unnamed protein product [Diatraea saccharalis]|uniref:RCC1 domain-containing protein 1 n=1 Tax=Diatraea saccharalis TaxID=40085 RepID=A0A9N9N0J1_9NEOP|nr:unnamed protein product [Diatraea saccharalis]
MYRISGTNLFEQWLEEDHIISDFRIISRTLENVNFDVQCAKLLQVNWSYNIFQIKYDFFLTGHWSGKGSKVLKVELPPEYNTCVSESNVTMVGNDYNIIFVDKKNNILWVMDLQNKNALKKINLNTELPLENSSKRLRRDSQILKVVLTNNSCLCLTTDGKVYNGLLPSLLDTSHCIGKVCDVRSGYEHFILLTDAGRVYTWGNGRRLQLGHGTLDNLDTPTEIEALAGIKITKIRAGGWHCLALSEFGDLYTWGWNDTGQLGVTHPDTKGVLNREGLKSYPLPTLVDILDGNEKQIDLDVKDIGCGSRHTAIMLEDNSIWTTGYNKYGQLGFSPENYPTVSYFKKTFQCDSSSVIECGNWSTVLINMNSAI